jgi:hypothetical protein
MTMIVPRPRGILFTSMSIAPRARLQPSPPTCEHPILIKTGDGPTAVQSDRARSCVTARLCGMATPRSLRLVSRQSDHRRVDPICVIRP